MKSLFHFLLLLPFFACTQTTYIAPKQVGGAAGRLQYFLSGADGRGVWSYLDTVTGTTMVATSDNSFMYAPAQAYGWHITQRDALKASNLPVPSFRPTTANTAIGVDIMPNGIPADFSSNGKAWLDVCDADIKTGQPAVNAARLGITSNAVQIGSTAFNGASGKPVEFLVANTKRMDFQTGSSETINLWSKRVAQTGSPSGDYVGYTMLNTNNTTANSDAIMFLGNDFANLRFGFFRWTNGAQPAAGYRNPNQFEIIANGGATNGLLLGAFGVSAPIKFQQGGGGAAEVGRFSAGRFLLGINPPDNGKDRLQVYGNARISDTVFATKYFFTNGTELVPSSGTTPTLQQVLSQGNTASTSIVLTAGTVSTPGLNLTGNASDIALRTSGSGNSYIAYLPEKTADDTFVMQSDMKQTTLPTTATPADPAAGRMVMWFDGTNLKAKKNVGGTVTITTLF